ncbi:peptidase M28 [Bacteroidia bacterium]|nr:peptidase M28 [Bacteroidia bacterium]
MKKVILGALLLAAASTTMQAQVQSDDEKYLRTYIKELSADQYGGRKPLSVHEGPVLEYITAKFKEAGLEPAVGGSYLQKVPLLSVTPHLRNNQIVVNGKKGKATLKYWDETVVWSLRTEKNVKVTNADYVFAGFGINAPEFGWNDYAGLDVKGKIVVILVNDPGFYDDNLFKGKNMTYYGRWTYKYEEASRQGAAGALIIHDTAPASYDWSVVQNSRAGASISVVSDQGNKELVAFQGWVTGDAAKKIFTAAGVSLDESLAAAKKKGFKSFPLGLKSTIEITNDVVLAESANVAGVLPGTTLKDEYIIYSAHWDHLGIGQAVDGDSIYNGAGDNASGVAALNLLAKRFHDLPERPKRSILFLAVTAEESGLLGSEYYSKHPIYPLKKTVVNLNVDGAGDKVATKGVVISHAGMADTDQYIKDAAATQGRTVTTSNDNRGGGFYRSDHFNFAKVGIPVILASGRTPVDSVAAKKHQELYGGKNTYHQPSDEYHDWWDFSGSLQDIYLFYGIGLRLANDGYFPQWAEGAEFKPVRDATK